MEHLLTTVGSLVAGGLGVYGATELVKWIKVIPINVGQTAKIRSVAGVLSVIAVALVNLANGTLEPQNTQDVALQLLEVVSVFFAAHVTHKINKTINES